MGCGCRSNSVCGILGAGLGEGPGCGVWKGISGLLSGTPCAVCRPWWRARVRDNCRLFFERRKAMKGLIVCIWILKGFLLRAFAISAAALSCNSSSRFRACPCAQACLVCGSLINAGAWPWNFLSLKEKLSYEQLIKIPPLHQKFLQTPVLKIFKLEN